MNADVMKPSVSGREKATAARSATHIKGARGKMIDHLLDKDEQPSLEDLAETHFRPTIQTGHELAETGADFSCILVSLANSHE